MCSQNIHWVQWGRRNSHIGIKAIAKNHLVTAHISHYKRAHLSSGTAVKMYKNAFAYQYFRSFFMGDSLDLGSQRAVARFHSQVEKEINPKDIVYTIANGDPILSRVDATYKIHEQVSCTLELAELRNRIQGTSHDLDLIRYREEVTFSSADLVVCPSDSVYDYVTSVCANVRAVKVPYPVPDLRQYSDRAAVHMSPGLSLAFAGRIEASKGVGIIFELARVFTNIDFNLFGVVMCEIPLLDNIIVHGKLPQNQLFEKMAVCSGFLFPSLSEGSSFATLEALGLGLPGIVSFQSGSHYRQHETGFVIDANDIDAWFESVQLIVDDPGILVGYRKNIESSSNYGIADYEFKMQGLLDRAVNNPGQNCIE